MTVAACNSGQSEHSNESKLPQNDSLINKKPLKPIESIDTIAIDFKTDRTQYSPDFLESIIQKISRKGVFKPKLKKDGSLNIGEESVEKLTIAYDSTEYYYFTTNYILNNILIRYIGFEAERSKRNPSYKPFFVLEEWSFNNNIARDSAFELINYVYRYPRNIVMYEKSYPQLMKAENKLIFLKTGADIFKKYVIEYGRLIEAFIQSRYK